MAGDTAVRAPGGTPEAAGVGPAVSVGRATASVVVGVLLLSVFALDAATHVGLAAGMLYVPVILAAAQLTTPRTVALVAAAAVVLTTVGAFLSPGWEAVPTLYAVANRVIACLAIGACGWFGAAMLRTREQQRSSNRWLRATRSRMEQQTRLLEMAGEVGRFGGWSVDVANGRAYLSEEVARIHGVDANVGLGLSEGIEYVVPEDQGRVLEAFSRCVADGTPFDLELQMVGQSDRRLRWVNVIGRAERDEGGTVSFVHGAMQDITDRIEAQLDAQTNRRRLDAMAAAAPFVLWAADASGSIDYLSEEFWRFTGRLPQDAVGAAWLESVHPADRATVSHHWEHALSTGEPYSVEFRIRHARGGYHWHLTRAVPERDADGAVVRWWGTSLDIHDRRTLEQEAGALADQLHRTLESIGDAVLALDTEWRATYVNREAERLLQHTREELLGRNIWTVFPAAVGSVFETEYQRAVAERRPTTFAAPFEPLGIDVEVSAYPHEHGLTIYFRDVSRRRDLGGPPAADAAHD